MNIALVGAGNVATFMAYHFAKCGHDLTAVVSNTLHSAQALAQKYKCIATVHSSEIPAHTQLILVAIPDDALTQITFTTNAAVVHTSGATANAQLAIKAPSIGCMWPVASINKDTYLQLSNIPICLCTDDKALESKMTELCGTFTNSIYTLQEHQKQQAHLVATIGNNFCNYLFAEAHSICASHQLDTSMFLNLFTQPLHQFEKGDNLATQTGAARRRDMLTQQKHLALLRHSPSLAQTYAVLSKNIEDKY